MTVSWFADIVFLFMRHLRITLRMPVFLVVSVVQPILWILLFGQLFKSVAEVPGFGSAPYLDFLVPGIVIMSALFGSAFGGVGILVDLDRGVIDRMLATSVHRSALILARVSLSGAIVLVQGALVLIVAFCLGVRIHGSIWSLAELLLTAALLGVATSSFSNAMALLTRRQEVLIAIINISLLPLTFLSSMIMSHSLMPGWIRTVCKFNPVDWAVVLARTSFQGDGWIAGMPYLGRLLLLLVGCLYLATRSFRRYQDSL